MVVRVEGEGLAGEKSTLNQAIQCRVRGQGVCFQSNADDGPKRPDGAPSISSLLSWFWCRLPSHSTSMPKSWSLLLTNLSPDEETPTPCSGPMAETGKQPKGFGELPSPHQSVLQILAEVSQKPWAASRPSLHCDTFGWCVLPWGCRTLRPTSCSGTKRCLQSSKERSLLSLPLRNIKIKWTCWASSWLFLLVFYRDTASEVCMSLIISKRLIAEFFMQRCDRLQPC